MGESDFTRWLGERDSTNIDVAVDALSPDGLVRETPLINLCGRGCSLTRWVGGRDFTNKLMWPWVISHGGRDYTNIFMGPWVLSHQMGWWERLH